MRTEYIRDLVASGLQDAGDMLAANKIAQGSSFYHDIFSPPAIPTDVSERKVRMTMHKKTEEEVKREVAQLKEKIEALKQHARELGHAFSSLDEAQLAKKVRGETSKSPFIYAQSWSSGTSPGNPAYYTANVQNPDPNGYFPVYVTIFFGLGNLFEASQAWIGRDKRWPEFSSDRTSLAAYSSQSFSFSYTVPTGLPLGTYNGNSVLWRGMWHDVGAALDRGSFDVKLL